MPTLNTGNAILSNAITVDSSYNVGIGQASPSYKLDVSGTGRFTGNTYISGGDFGVGTTSPETFSGYRTAEISATLGGIVFAKSTTGSITTQLVADNGPNMGYVGTRTNHAFSIRTNNTDKVTITASGSVGIGTSSPSGQLDVYSSGTDLATYFSQASAGNNNFTRWTRASGPTLIAGVVRNSNDGNQKANTAFIGTTNAYDFLFYTNDLQRLKIASNGDLILGLSDYSLFAEDSGGLCIEQAGTTATKSKARLQASKSNDGTNYSQLIVDPYNGLLFTKINGGNGNMSIYGGLTIGNTSNQGEVFYIASQVMSSNAGTHYLKWNSANGKVTYDSSTRLVKSDIIDSPYGLNEILKLKPRKYYRTDDERNEIGFIADEVYEILPELVPMSQKSLFTKDENDTELIPSGVNYDKISAIIVKAIQEQQAQIQEMNTKIDQQQQTINSLINR